MEKELKDIHLRQDGFEQRLFAQEQLIKKLDDQYREITSLLKPISQTYQTASKLGKWIMALMVFISIMLGVALSLKSLLKK